MSLLLGLPKLLCLGLGSLSLGTANCIQVVSAIHTSCQRLTLLDISDNGIAGTGGAALGALIEVGTVPCCG